MRAGRRRRQEARHTPSGAAGYADAGRQGAAGTIYAVGRPAPVTDGVRTGAVKVHVQATLLEGVDQPNRSMSPRLLRTMSLSVSPMWGPVMHQMNAGGSSRVIARAYGRQHRVPRWAGAA